jgi:ABC-type antimicrobial peptide transport system permease subunit
MTPGRTSRQNYVLAASGPRFFDTLRIPILSGRDFDERDTRGSAAVAIVNQRLAQTLWPGQDPVGRQLKLSDGKPPLTVVGLAKTVRSFPIGPPFFQIYVPFTQFEVAGIALYVRSAHGQEEGVRNQLSEELRGSLPGAAVLRVQALTERVGSVLAIPQALAAVLGLLGGAALFLATVGLYGVTAYIAGRRARECAVRRVCGASRLSILSLVLRDAMRTILIGVGAGLALSLVVGWLLKHAVLGAAFDPIALVVAPTVLASTALAAVAWPVFRATSVDPMLVLRED